MPYRLVKADWKGHKTLGGQELGDWAEVSIGDCAEVMLRAAKNRDMYSQIAMMSAPVVRQKYDWRRFAERVYEVWRGDCVLSIHERGMFGAGYEIPVPA